MNKFFLLILLLITFTGCSIAKGVEEIAGIYKKDGGSKGPPAPTVLVVVVNGDKDNNVEISGNGTVRTGKENKEEDKGEVTDEETRQSDSQEEIKPEGVDQTESESVPPAEVTVTQRSSCGVYLMPVVPRAPALPRISPELRDNPEALANLLIDHLAALREYEIRRNEIITNSYSNYLKSCR